MKSFFVVLGFELAHYFKNKVYLIYLSKLYNILLFLSICLCIPTILVKLLLTKA